VTPQRDATRLLILSAAAYVAITVVMGRQVIDAFSTAIASDPGDPLLTAAILSWNASHVPWTNAWYQFPIFYPTADALTLSEHLLGVSLIAAPIQWITGNPVVAYNATLLLSYPLCGLAMCALVWRLTRNGAAAFLAGLAYAFAPYRAGHLPHIQILSAFWMPLALLGLHSFLDSSQTGRRWPWLVLFAASWLLQGAANGYYLVYFTFVVGLWVIWFMAARGRWRDAVAVTGALVVAALPLAPILYRYVVAQKALGLSHSIGAIASYSADIAAPLCAPNVLTFWGWLRVACDAEGELFAGVTLIALCIIGVMRERRPSNGPAEAARGIRLRVVVLRAALVVAAIYAAITLVTLVIGPWRIEFPLRASASTADKPASVTVFFLLAALLLSRRLHTVVRRGSTTTFYLLCAAFCWILALGPFPHLFGKAVLYQAPYAWLMLVPGADALRVPARLWVMVLLCLTVFVGLVLARLLEAKAYRTARTIVIVVACGFVADGWTTIRAAPVPTATATIDLRGKTVLFLPVGEVYPDIGAVYQAVTGGYRTVNGYSGYQPPYYQALRTLSDEADGRLFGPFVHNGALHVIARRGIRGLVEQQPGAQLVSDQRAFLHYVIPSRPVTPLPTTPTGVRIPIADITSACSPERTGLLIDGDLKTRWGCGVQKADESFIADLGAPTPVGTVVNALGSAGGDFARTLRIETSLDAHTWTTAWEGSPAAQVLYAAMKAPLETRAVIEFPARSARYVRLSQLGRDDFYPWSIAEMEIWSGE
jgi:hypothetical protein